MPRWPCPEARGAEEDIGGLDSRCPMLSKLSQGDRPGSVRHTSMAHSIAITNDALQDCGHRTAGPALGT